MSGAHAFLPPSMAARWIVCALSPTMAARYPDEDTAESREGTAAHWAIEEMFAGRMVAVGQVSPNGVTLTEEMIEGAELFITAVYEHMPHVEVQVEKRVHMPSIHPNNWGTPDARYFLHFPSTGRGVLRLYDYKFGHGYVEVFENWQLIDYADGVLEEMGVDGHADHYIDVEFTIVQPRSYHKDGPVRKWRTTATELRPLFNKLRNAAEAAHQPNPPGTPSAECQHCSGRHACVANQRSAYRAADLSVVSAPVELDDTALGQELRMLQRAQVLLNSRITGLSQQVETRVRAGHLVPGYAVENTQGRLAWYKPLPEVLALGAIFGKDLSKPGLITPNQAIKLGIDAKVVEAYSERPSSGFKLVQDDGTMARKTFGAK